MRRKAGFNRPRREGKASGTESHSGERYVIGINAVREVLRSDPDRITRAMITTAGSELRAELEAADIKVSEVAHPMIARLVGSDSHQGVCIAVTSAGGRTIAEWLAALTPNERVVIVALDELTDPHNIGAIYRAVECCGAAAVVLPQHRSGGLTPVVSKTSAGASELVETLSITNLRNALDKFHDAGFEIVVADVGPGTIPLQNYTPAERVVLVLGSEGNGPRRIILDSADVRVTIPMRGNIDSLNVSQAAAVMLYAICK